MYQEHRKYQHCIFCPCVDLTKEHVFGRAFADFLGVTLPWKGHTLKGTVAITRIAPKLLCK